MRWKLSLSFGKLVAIVAGPGVFAALPAAMIESGPALCIWKRLFERECLGCGITRALWHAMRLDWPQAWDHNALVVVVLPIMAIIWLKMVARQLGKVAKSIEPVPSGHKLSSTNPEATTVV